jgi:hypothetical protein
MGRRKKRNVKARKTYAFVVDGETEIWYLQMLKRNERELTIGIEPKLPSKKTLTEQYKMVEALARDYTKVFWIVDYDVIRKETREAKPGIETSEQQFIRLRKNAQEIGNVIVIVNDPCLEFWFLLHLVETARFYDQCSPVERDLSKRVEGYEKTKQYFTKQGQDIYLRLKPHLPEAIHRSKALTPFDPYDTGKAVCEMERLFEEEDIKSIV